MNAASSAAFSSSRSAGAAVGALQHHVVQPGAELAPARLADLEGLLVDHLEAHVLQHRHPLRQRDRAAVAPDLQADAGLAVLAARIEIDAERPVRPTAPR